MSWVAASASSARARDASAPGRSSCFASGLDDGIEDTPALDSRARRAHRLGSRQDVEELIGCFERDCQAARVDGRAGLRLVGEGCVDSAIFCRSPRHPTRRPTPTTLPSEASVNDRPVAGPETTGMPFME